MYQRREKERSSVSISILRLGKRSEGQEEGRKGDRSALRFMQHTQVRGGGLNSTRREAKENRWSEEPVENRSLCLPSNTMGQEISLNALYEIYSRIYNVR